jgi:peptidyl-prolyl cis-trans isomerase D
MLKVLRDNLKYLSWILWGVIVVFVLFVFVDFGGGVPGPALRTESAATVGDEEISYGELQRAYQQTESAYREAYGNQFTPELARQLQLPLQVLEQLVQQRILLGEAESMGLAVSDVELQKELLEQPIFKDETGSWVGDDRYQQLVRSIGYATPEDFEETIRTQLVLTKLNRVVANNIVVSDDDVERAYREGAERAKIRYVKLPISTFRDDSEISAEEVTTYFDANIEDFRLSERRSVDYLLVDTNAISANLSLTDDEVRAYFEQNSAEYETQEQVRARQIMVQVTDERNAEQALSEIQAIAARITAGEDFAQLATELSDDPLSRDNGGDLGLFARGQYLEEIETAAFSAQAGDMVGPVQSGFGYHLIQVTEHLPGGLPAFEAVSDSLRRRLLAERARESATAKGTELAERIRREGLTDRAGFETIAQEDEAISFQSTPAFGRSDNVPGVGRSTPFSSAAFALTMGATSDPVRVGSGWAVMRLADIEEPRLPELTDVESDVRARLRDQRTEATAKARMAAARMELIDGTTLDDVAAGLDGTVEESSEFAAGQSLGSLGVNAELASAALALEQGGTGEPLVAGTDVILFQVSERTHFDPVEFEANRDATREELSNQRLGELLATLVASRREELSVSYDPKLMDNLGLGQQG